MNQEPPRKPFHPDFLDELKKGHPLFWLVAALIALIFLIKHFIP